MTTNKKKINQFTHPFRFRFCPGPVPVPLVCPEGWDGKEVGWEYGKPVPFVEVEPEGNMPPEDIVPPVGEVPPPCCCIIVLNMELMLAGICPVAIICRIISYGLEPAGIWPVWEVNPVEPLVDSALPEVLPDPDSKLDPEG
nr:hypothetical protein BaRGS_011539 [Batillaria attramentaria]